VRVRFVTVPNFRVLWVRFCHFCVGVGLLWALHLFVCIVCVCVALRAVLCVVPV
jgi:hypothetical protein